MRERTSSHIKEPSTEADNRICFSQTQELDVWALIVFLPVLLGRLVAQIAQYHIHDPRHRWLAAGHQLSPLSGPTSLKSRILSLLQQYLVALSSFPSWEISTAADQFITNFPITRLIQLAASEHSSNEQLPSEENVFLSKSNLLSKQCVQCLSARCTSYLFV